MSVLYVTSARQGEGKTALCAALAQLLRNQGKKAAAFKPFADEGAPDNDGTIYQTLLGQEVDGWPVEISGGEINDSRVSAAKATADKISGDVDVLVVEGSSVIPWGGHKQLVEAFEAQAIVVASYNATMSSIDISSAKEAFGERFAGIVINNVSRYSGHDLKTRLIPEIEGSGLAVLGAVPEDRRLLGLTANQIAEHLNGRFVEFDEELNGLTDNLIEHLMVGAMMLDNSEFYFGIHENKAAIIRGDRPDLFMGALHTKTACLIATKGIEPIEYILNEAEQEAVPLMVVETDTLGTMAALSNILERAAFDHPLKLQRMVELVEANVDSERIFNALNA